MVNRFSTRSRACSTAMAIREIESRRRDGRTGGCARRRRPVARLIAVGLGVAVATGAVAETPVSPAPAVTATEASAADRRAATRAELDQIQRDIEIGRTRQAELRRDIDGLERDRTRIAEQVLRTAARIQASEARVGASEVRIQGLDDDLARLRTELAGRRGVLADVLAALQRIGRKPPPAVVVRPEDALGAVRSAILIGALLPELRAQAERLIADLATLEEVKQAAAAERDRFRAEATDLATERIRLELLQEERRQSRGDQERRLDEERHHGQELAEKANGLKDLIARLEAEAQRPGPTPAPETRPGGVGDAGRLQPAVAFAETRGTLNLPATGRFVRRFGEDDGLGGTAKGVTLVTRDRAQVTSPCDGWVVFLGPFRSYGKLLIINGGGGYHVVLAGLDRIDVEPGRFVLAGEPVGVMGSGVSAGVAAGAPGAKDETAGRPALYVEFRKDNASIDPMPWWTQTRDEKVRG